MPVPPKSDDTASRGAERVATATDDSTDRPIHVPEVPDPYIGTTLGERYKVQRKLGAGGMGAVYLAEHIVIERKIAIKILSQDFAHKADLVQRFIQEARAAARIGHENIVEVYDFGETASGSVFFAMEYLEGRDLANLIQEGTMSTQRVRAIALQVCKALSAAHSKQIIHRDLKPENIYLIEREGRQDFVKILDFGIAKISNVDENASGRLTRAGMIFGTPEYMSPEQARGETPDHRVDIYALGCIIYEMLSGKVPFQAETFMGTLNKQMFSMPEPPSRRIGRQVAPDLESICLKAMEKDAAHRFQTMQEFAQALENEGVMVANSISSAMISGGMMQTGMGGDPSLSMRAGLPGSPFPSPGSATGYPPLQPGMYAMPSSGIPQQMGNAMSGAIQAAMPNQVSGVVGVVAAPMSGGTYSGMLPAPIISNLAMPAVNGYTTAPPTSFEVRQPSSAQWRRLVFILAGATIGVVVLALLLFWPSEQLPRTQVKPPPPRPTSRPDPNSAASRGTSSPAHLIIQGLAGSRVLLDFKDIGVISTTGQLIYDVTSPGTAEWSVHIKVVKDDRAEYVTRMVLKSGGSATVAAEQPLNSDSRSGPKRHGRPK